MLTGQQRRELLRVLSRHADVIERVDAYGSRVLGTARPGSDIDLVLAGDIGWRERARIMGQLDDSYLSINADVTADALIEPDFRDAIAPYRETLFTREDLRAARDQSTDAGRTTAMPASR